MTGVKRGDSATTKSRGAGLILIRNRAAILACAQWFYGVTFVIGYVFSTGDDGGIDAGRHAARLDLEDTGCGAFGFTAQSRQGRIQWAF